jgi:hypothetical protein
LRFLERIVVPQLFEVRPLASPLPPLPSLPSSPAVAEGEEELAGISGHTNNVLALCSGKEVQWMRDYEYDLSDWYGVTTEEFCQAAQGQGLLLVYGGSLQRLLQALYPQYPWDFSRRPQNIKSANHINNSSDPSLVSSSSSPPPSSSSNSRARRSRNFWKEPRQARKFLEEAGEVLEIADPSEWGRVSLRQLRSLGGRGLLSRWGGRWVDLLHAAFPEHSWNSQALQSRGKKSEQRWLWLIVKQWMRNNNLSSSTPTLEVMEDFRHPKLRLSAESQHLGELDVFVPQLNLAFEYQGRQHYEDLPVAAFGPLELYTQRDSLKRELCDREQIHLVEVPYWWDCSLESLKATVLQSAEHKPELLAKMKSLSLL